MSLASRVTEQLINLGISQSYLARQVGLSQAAVQKLCAGKSQSSKKIVEIAKILKVDVNWLLYGGETRKISPWDSSTPVDDDEVELSYFREVELAAGSGGRKIEFNDSRKLRFSRRTLDRMGIQVRNAACVTVSGNSMEPVMPNGSTVGVDTGNTILIDGDIYALGHHGCLRVKIVYALPWGGIRLKSFNSSEWPDETYDSLDDIKILGRVFWYSALI
jgi:phage repressor protein C with HTH and peptisase S24 domain